MELLFEANRIYMQDETGRTVAEVTFPAVAEGVVELNHTFVDDSLRGQGVAGRLVEAAAERLRAQGQKVRPTCSYAVGWFEKHPEYSDILLRDK